MHNKWCYFWRPFGRTILVCWVLSTVLCLAISWAEPTARTWLREPFGTEGVALVFGYWSIVGASIGSACGIGSVLRELTSHSS